MYCPLPLSPPVRCTAALAELSYTDVEGYTGEVEFISVEEWGVELESLLADLTQQDGRAVLSSDDGRPNYGSYCKLRAVYGDAYTKSRVPAPGGGYR